MGFISNQRNPLVFRRGWDSPTGLPAYLVEDETDPDEPTGDRLAREAPGPA